jgi:hypothetical protein
MSTNTGTSQKLALLGYGAIALAYAVLFYVTYKTIKK